MLVLNRFRLFSHLFISDLWPLRKGEHCFLSPGAVQRTDLWSSEMVVWGSLQPNHGTVHVRYGS